MAQYNYSVAYDFDMQNTDRIREKELEQKKLIKQKKQEKLARKLQVKNAVKIIAVVAFAAVVAMGLLYREVQVFEGEKKIAQLEKELKLIETQTYQKMYDMEKNTDLKQIEDYAMNTLGMIKLDKSQVVNMTIEQDDYVEKNLDDTKVLKKASDFIETAFENLVGIFASK